MSRRSTPRLLIGLAAATTLVVAGGCGDDESSETNSSRGAAAEVVEVSDLSAAAEGAEGDIYWLGERPDTELELSEGDGGVVTIRYLPEGTQAGAPRSEILTVATYPSDDGVKEIRQAALETEGATVGRTSDGAVLLVGRTSANSAHLAFPDGSAQIEVYSPEPGQALKLASSGRVEPVP